MKSKRKVSISAKRTKHISFSLNEQEFAMVDSYMRKYKIQNRSRWLRKTIITHVFKSLEQDYPTLFDENEMRR